MKHTQQTVSVIEPEILDEQGHVISGPKTAARREHIYVYRRAGFLTGFIALACSVGMMIFMALLMCLLVPVLLLGRMLGLSLRKLSR